MALDRNSGDEQGYVNVRFSREAYNDVRREAKRRNIPVNKLIQESIAVNRKIAEVRDKGGQVILKHGRQRRELVVDE